MNLFEVNEDTCNQDGICAAVCPAGIIDIQKGAYPAPVDGAEEICIECGHCVAVCPTASFSHRDMPKEKCPPLNPDLNISLEQCEQFLRSRRSTRRYRKRPVSQELLSKLIRLARYAPTGHNSQGVAWLVMGDRDELNRLAGVTVDWMRWMLKNEPEFAQSLHMGRTIRRWEEGKDIVFRGAPVVIVAHAAKHDLQAQTSCTIALSYLELAAAGLGLGSCWAGYFNAAANNFPPMMEALPLPDGHQCRGAMMVGYPTYTYHRLPLRKPPEITWRL
jgi:nitroreductase/NAD-dependent dihydropyrimidine dehydrogenase PreA subunit